jgi:hypothetical protein
MIFMTALSSMCWAGFAAAWQMAKVIRKIKKRPADAIACATEFVGRRCPKTVIGGETYCCKLAGSPLIRRLFNAKPMPNDEKPRRRPARWARDTYRNARPVSGS